MTALMSLLLASLLPAAAADAPEAPSSAEAPAAEAPAPEAPSSAEPPPLEAAIPAAPAAASGPFETPWKEAKLDEKAVFLEANPELKVKIQEAWDKATPKSRKAALGKFPLLGQRALKHRWAEATPEEKIAFLGTNADLRRRVTETWNLLNADQRLQLVRRRPAHARTAVHHAWGQATPEEKIAFVESQGDLRKKLARIWAMGGGSERALEDASADERSGFLEAASGLEQSSRERWDSMNPGLRAQLVRKWAGWKVQPSLLGLIVTPKAAAKKPAAKSAAKAKRAASYDE